MISVSDLGKSFGDRTLFANVSLQLNPGERYGLVGANGSGKSTFLGILAGHVEASTGQVAIPKRLRVGVLRQDHFLHEEEPILGVAMMGNPELWQAIAEKEELLARAGEDFDVDRFSDLEEIVQRHDGYSAEARAATILEGLGLPAEVHRNALSTLSGGFKLRVLLAQVLAGAPDILLLDEPTNHLDILSIRWLEGFLASYPGTVVVISHDHRFLDRVSTHILDVDYERITLWPGNYTAFLDQKVSDRERREKEVASREKEIAHHQRFVDRFKAKASKARQAQSKVRMIEKMADSIEELAPSSRRYPTFRFQQLRPSGKEVVKVKGVEKAFESKRVLHGVDLRVERGDRLAIMGPNGIGKSTLLKILVGKLEADAGAVEWGYETHPGYFAQDQKEQLDSSAGTAEDWIWSFCPEKDLGFVRGRMAMMLFSGDEGKKRLSALSGGEAARLVFSRLMLERPNVLILDEPTNHLDLESIEALVEGLLDFDGTLIFVSHDRWFVGQVATRIVEITPERVHDYLGTYEEYVAARGDDHLDAERVIEKARVEDRIRREGGAQGGGDRSAAERNGGGAGARRSRPGRPKGGRFGLERRREELLGAIAEQEERVAEIDRVFADPDWYAGAAPVEIRAMETERGECQLRVENLLEEWEEIEEDLAELAGRE